MKIKTDLTLNQEVTPENVAQVIKEQIESNQLLIYMKGSSLMPQCGFSAQTVGIFDQLGVSYTTFNVLSNDLIREGIKAYSNWPTIPQVYFKQKFIGGCDIVTELYQSGELESMLKA